MKKSLFLMLFSILTVFMVAGCSDDDSSSSTPPTSELTGTYKITFFGTQVTNVQPANADMASFANMFYITNDCEKAKKITNNIIGVDEKNNCTNESNTTLMENSSVVISINDDGKLAITSQVQMSGDILNASQADKYQFTEYYPTKDFSDDKAEGKGVKGWNYDSENNKISDTSTNFPESPYKITKQDDGSFMINMTLVGKKVDALNVTVDAVTTVIMEYVSEDTTPLEKNLLPFPATTE